MFCVFFDHTMLNGQKETFTAEMRQ